VDALINYLCVGAAAAERQHGWRSGVLTFMPASI